MWITLFSSQKIVSCILLSCIIKLAISYKQGKFESISTMEIPPKLKIKKLVIDYIESMTEEVPDLGVGKVLQPKSEKLKAIALTLHRLTSSN
jgi:hypothetical protein